MTYGFSCNVTRSDGRATLGLAGELDIAGAAEARKALLALDVPRGGRLVIDLRALAFMDSTGVRLILQALQWAESHGASLVLVPGPAPVHHILEVVGLAEQLATIDGLED